jgi:hypothetical protein
VGAAHDPSAVPDTAAVARGWTAQVERLVRLDLPPSPAIDLVPAVRAHLLQAAGGAGAGPEVAAAAATAGFGVADPDELLVAALAALPGDGDGGGLGAVLWAAGLLVGLGAALPPARRVAMAAEELARAQAAGPAHLAGPGLEAAATLLDQRSEQRAAATARAWAAAAPAGPARGGQDADSTGGVWRPADLAAGAQVVALTGSPDWLVVLARLVATARPTAVWPDLLDPLTGGGCGVDGHDPVVTARYWSTLRSALLADDDGGVDLLPAWPPAWRAAPVEAHQLPSRHGLVSFALRWHGDRPALLWSVDGATGPLVVRASGPAPSWSSTDAAGEVLLPRVPSDVGPGSVQGS